MVPFSASQLSLACAIVQPPCQAVTARKVRQLLQDSVQFASPATGHVLWAEFAFGVNKPGKGSLKKEDQL